MNLQNKIWLLNNYLDQVPMTVAQRKAVKDMLVSIEADVGHTEVATGKHDSGGFIAQQLHAFSWPKDDARAAAELERRMNKTP